MELSLRQIRYLRLLKQGLITPFSDLTDLFADLEIQAQNENDAYFNANRRLANPTTVEEIQKAAIRVWYVRNTIFLMSAQHYDKAVFVNNIIDNWFRKMRIVTAQDEAELVQIIDYCKCRDFVSVDELVESGFNKSFIRVWSGAFIEMVRRGVLRSKYKKQLEMNHGSVNTNFTLDEIMRSYFDIYGPATLKDFKHWLGKSVPEANAAFGRIQSAYIRVNENMLLARKDLSLLESSVDIPMIITGKFDPVCLSYHDKSWLIDEEHKSRVWGKAGIVEAVILIDGAIVATWRRNKDKLNVYPITRLTKLQKKEISNRFHEIFDKNVEVVIE